MKMKLLIAIVDDDVTDDIIEAAREAGATGATIINNAHGEGLKVEKTFFGLDLSGQRDIILFLVVAERARRILEAIEKGGRLLEDRNMGLALQLDIEDAVGLRGQLTAMLDEIKDEV